MIRMYEQPAIQIAAILKYLTNVKISYEDICKDLHYKVFNYDISLEELRAQIVEQFDHPTHEKDLIDTIVAALQATDVGSVLSGRTIETLRKAILLPEELTELKEKLRVRTIGCNKCGRELNGYECVVMQENPNETHKEIRLYCVRCAYPEIVACSTCKTGTVRLPEEVVNSLRKARQCDDCKEKASGKVREEPEGHRNVANPFVVALREGRGARPIYRAVVPPNWRVWDNVTIDPPTTVGAVTTGITNDFPRWTTAEVARPEDVPITPPADTVEGLLNRARGYTVPPIDDGEAAQVEHDFTIAMNEPPPNADQEPDDLIEQTRAAINTDRNDEIPF
jgi:hypothetical protein